MPLFATLGAEGGGSGKTIHSSFPHRNLGMSIFQWG